MLFTDYALRFVTSLSGVEERTRHDYERDLKNHIMPTFGGLDLRDESHTFDRVTVSTWVNELHRGVPHPDERRTWLRRPRAPKTIQNLHGLLYAVLQSAVGPPHRSASPILPPAPACPGWTTARATRTLLERHVRTALCCLLFALTGDSLVKSLVCGTHPGDAVDHGSARVNHDLPDQLDGLFARFLPESGGVTHGVRSHEPCAGSAGQVPPAADQRQPVVRILGVDIDEGWLDATQNVDAVSLSHVLCDAEVRVRPKSTVVPAQHIQGKRPRRIFVVHQAYPQVSHVVRNVGVIRLNHQLQARRDQFHECGNHLGNGECP
ncbi:hypothetical protein [Streptosporangium carneum]|uniref:Core-binding (CB) domain-containing protein n=1 Tax=Streptosporangium carneum TaxID=47481 RepID=A0A9W6I2Y4_9ACTN|nr:hypothetical protein [Streptosporangium carneum]GLK10446.1 hypothetical protein GCM10017600_38520 [Streptosporangium carneum]